MITNKGTQNRTIKISHTMFICFIFEPRRMRNNSRDLRNTNITNGKTNELNITPNYRNTFKNSQQTPRPRHGSPWVHVPK